MTSAPVESARGRMKQRKAAGVARELPCRRGCL